MTLQDVMTVIQTLVLIVGIGIGLCTLLRQKKDNKAMATLNMILHQRSDVELRKASEAIRNKGKDNVIYFSNNDLYRHYVLKVLNLREITASAINHGILDENTYKQIFYSLVLSDWEDLKDVIYTIRKEQKSETLFQDFESLVRRWQKQPLIKKI